MSKFTHEQFGKLADIFSDIGAIGFASVVLPAFTDRFNPIGGLVGLVGAGIFWYSSLVIAKREKGI